MRINKKDFIKARVNISITPRQIGRERALVLAKALKVHPAVILFPDYDIAEAA